MDRTSKISVYFNVIFAKKYDTIIKEIPFSFASQRQLCEILKLKIGKNNSFLGYKTSDHWETSKSFNMLKKKKLSYDLI